MSLSICFSAQVASSESAGDTCVRMIHFYLKSIIHVYKQTHVLHVHTWCFWLC